MAQTQYHTQGANPCGYPVGSNTHRTRCLGEVIEPASAASNGQAPEPVSIQKLAARARSSGISHKQVQAVMDIVVGEGLVAVNSSGRSTTYSPV
jgi:hypothetical protein